MKGNNQLRLFRLVRKGYDPEEVLDCFWDLVQAFSQREKTHDIVQSKYLDEIMKLKIAVNEGQLCIQELQGQIDRLTRKAQAEEGQGPPRRTGKSGI